MAEPDAPRAKKARHDDGARGAVAEGATEEVAEHGIHHHEKMAAMQREIDDLRTQLQDVARSPPRLEAQHTENSSCAQVEDSISVEHGQEGLQRNGAMAEATTTAASTTEAAAANAEAATGATTVADSSSTSQGKEANGPPRWYAVDLKKKAKVVNLALSDKAVQVLKAEMFKAGGKLSRRQLPMVLPSSEPNKILEARVVTLAEMQTPDSPGWWQISSQYASAEDAARIVLIQQAKHGDVQGKRHWRLLVRVPEGSALQQILANEVSTQWQIAQLAVASERLFYSPAEEAQLARQIVAAARLMAAQTQAAKGFIAQRKGLHPKQAPGPMPPCSR